MKVERPNAKPPSPEEVKDLEKLKALIERAIADGRLSAQEMDSIKRAMNADGKVTCEELDLCRQLIWNKIDTGELEHSW